MNILKSFNDALSMKQADSFIFTNPYIFHGVPLGTVFVYFILVKTLPGILQKFYDPPPPRPPKGTPRKPKEHLSILEWIMFFHNLLNSAVSAFAVFYGGFFYVSLFFEVGLGNVICDPTGFITRTKSPINVMCPIYVMCKYIELLDTLFLILKNPYREVYFLHWYHHITVLLFAWYSHHLQTSISFMFGLVNMLIHMFMYYYYAIAIISTPPKWGRYMMMGQMAQMFFALGVFVYYNYRYFFTDDSCYMNEEVIPVVPKSWLKVSWFLYCYLMYASYLYLFASMFVKRFIQKKSYKKIQSAKEK